MQRMYPTRFENCALSGMVIGLIPEISVKVTLWIAHNLGITCLLNMD